MLRYAALAIVAAVGAVACVNLNDEEPAITLWDAQLSPAITHPGLSGQAAAVSRPDGTSLGIGLEGAQPGARFAWGLHLGSCTAPDQQIGPDSDYPVLEADATGAEQAETHLGPRLSLDNAYHVEVRASAGDRTRVACGDLIAR